MKNICIFLADGFEDTEAIATLDVLNRAKKMFPGKIDKIDLISMNKKSDVLGANNIKVITDILFENFEKTNYDIFIIPGGGNGVDYLINDQNFLETIKWANDQNKIISAICAAPQILGKLNIIKNKKVSFYPGAEKFLDDSIKSNEFGAITDGNIITGRAIGTSLEFGLEILKSIIDSKEIEKIRKTLYINL